MLAGLRGGVRGLLMDGRRGAEGNTRDSTSRPERGEVVSQSVARLGVAMDLDEFERLAKLYVEERFTYDRRLLELLRLSDFILWLRQRERQSVAGESDTQ